MRSFASSVLAPLFALLALTPIVACSAETATPSFEEGKHYKRVREAAAPGKRIQVNEFFWYGCSHCAAFEPIVQAWAKARPADVDFVQTPNSLGRPVGMLHAKAFYAAEALSVHDKTHSALFDAIHNKHQHLETEDQVVAFFTEKTGILPDVFKGTLNGFAVDSRFRNSEALTKQYGIASTPVLVVDGRYQIDARMAGGFDQMLKIADFLIDKARKERKK